MPLHLSIINSYWYNELFCMQTFYCLQSKLYCQISLSVKYPSECRINCPANVIKIDQSSMIIWMSRNIFMHNLFLLCSLLMHYLFCCICHVTFLINYYCSQIVLLFLIMFYPSQFISMYYFVVYICWCF